MPHLHPESLEFENMPGIGAMVNMVGLFQWACIQGMIPIDPAREQTVGIDVDPSHTAATPPGMVVMSVGQETRWKDAVSPFSGGR